MSMTKEEAIRLHRQLWGWLAENPMKKKEDWPGWTSNGGEHIPNGHYCFCCVIGHDDVKCNCPLEWPNGARCTNSYYLNWSFGSGGEERKRLAALIRDLPVKEEKKPEPKSEPKFRVGDRVRVTMFRQKGMSGIVRDIANGFTFGVEYPQKIAEPSPRWDEEFPNKKGYGWYEDILWLEPIPRNEAPEKKTITETITYHINGPVTVCIITNNHGKFKGMAKCSPDDEWDEEYGKYLARDRARDKEDEALEKILINTPTHRYLQPQ